MAVQSLARPNLPTRLLVTKQPNMPRPLLQVQQPRFFGKMIEVALPDLGEGTKEATIKEWYVKPGSTVSEFDDLVEVYTDKLVAKIPSTCDGIVKEISYEIDDICLVGHSLLRIEVEDGSAAATQEAPKEQDSDTSSSSSSSSSASDEEKTTPQSRSGPVHQKALSTPAVRHLAKKNGIDINEIEGTGKAGRVTKADVLAAMEPASSQPQKAASKPAASTIAVASASASAEDQVKKIVGIKKAMTKTMTASLSIPTFTFSDDADCTKLIELRQTLKTQIEGGITKLPFMIKALSLAMEVFPEVNSTVSQELDAEGLIQSYTVRKAHNFAIAIDSNNGLTTPVLKNVNNKSIKQINADLKDLVVRTQENRLSRDDFEGGSFSVSSVGNIGGRYFVPTILPPQAAIIAIGQARKIPKYTGDGSEHAWEPYDSVSYSITADHRILDGATVARFSQSFKQFLEDPNLMLISM